MSSSHFGPSAITGLALCSVIGIIPLYAGAQQPASDAPPKLEKLEEGNAPDVTIRSAPPEQEITEYREQGRVTLIKVKAGKSTYYLKPNTPPGSALPGDAQSNTMRAAQWQIMEFNLGGNPDQEQVARQATSVPAPPTSPAAASARTSAPKK